VDSVIICQPYHTLRRADELAVVRRALHDEDGTLGLVWHRATAAEEWMEAFNACTTAPRSDLSVPAMPAGERTPPLAWVERLRADNYRFKPFRHRKFVERLTAPLAQLLPVARLTSDARMPMAGAEDAMAAAAAAAEIAQAKAGITGLASLTLDLHAFHTAVIPTPKKG